MGMMNGVLLRARIPVSSQKVTDLDSDSISSKDVMGA